MEHSEIEMEQRSIHKNVFFRLLKFSKICSSVLVSTAESASSKIKIGASFINFLPKKEQIEEFLEKDAMRRSNKVDKAYGDLKEVQEAAKLSCVHENIHCFLIFNFWLLSKDFFNSSK